MKDEIIEQVWKAKDQIASECGHDLRKLAALLQKRQQQRRHKIVNLTNQQATHSPTKL